MAFNPMQLMGLKQRAGIFKNQHPKIIDFFKKIYKDVDEGTMIEIKITTSNGKEHACGMKVTADDMETYRQLLSLKK
ncbi:MAG: hypothetical protein SOV71_04305 [Anaerovoracaceae bacterium]|nr:hypothetical protein [Bacillota bacterium]MDY2670762.1 hypothetical protein [Anaerovoracaceae bacterium]